MFRFAAVLLLISSPSLALADDPWLGQKVFWKYDAKAKASHRKFDVAKIAFPATVESVKGDWLWLGRAWIRKQDVMRAPEAIDYYTRGISAEPSDPGSWSNRGAVRFEIGEIDKAINDFTEAIRLDPKHAPAYNNRGKAWFAKEEYEKAIDDYTRAIDVSPKDMFAYTNRGNAWKIKGEYDKAIEDHSKAIELEPKNAIPYANRGFVWLLKRDYDRAIGDYGEAIHLDPKDAIAYDNRGNARVAKGDYDGAISDANEAIRLNPQAAEAYSTLGNAWMKKGDYDKAISGYVEAIRVDPTYIEPYNALAWLRATCPVERFRDGKQAVKYATQACTLQGWKHWASIDTLAAAHAEAGQFDDAIKWEQKAIEMAPTEEGKQDARKRLELYKSGQPYRQESKE